MAKDALGFNNLNLKETGKAVLGLGLLAGGIAVIGSALKGLK